MDKHSTHIDTSNVVTTLDDAFELPDQDKVLPVVDSSQLAINRNTRESASFVILATPDGTYEEKKSHRDGEILKQDDPKEPSLTDAQKEKLFSTLQDNLQLPDTCREAKNKFGQIKRALENNPRMQRSLWDMIEAGLQPTAFAYDKDHGLHFGDVLEYEDTTKHEAVLAALTPEQMDAAVTCVINTYSARNEQPYTSAEQQEIRNWFAQNPQRVSGQGGLNDLDALMFAGHFNAKLISHEENEVMARNNPKIYDRIWTWLGDQDLLKVVRSGKNGVAPCGYRFRGWARRVGNVAGVRGDFQAARVAGLWVQIAA